MVGEPGVLELPASAVAGALVGAFQLAHLQLVKRNCWAVALRGVVGGHRAGRSAEAATLVASRPSALGADPRSEGCRLGSWWGSPASQWVSWGCRCGTRASSGSACRRRGVWPSPQEAAEALGEGRSCRRTTAELKVPAVPQIRPAAPDQSQETCQPVSRDPILLRAVERQAAQRGAAVAATEAQRAVPPAAAGGWSPLPPPPHLASRRIPRWQLNLLNSEAVTPAPCWI